MTQEYTSDTPKAIILLSGGMDSATTLAIAKDKGFAPYCLSFHYGQRHGDELVAARQVANHIGVIDHKIITIDLKSFGGSALTHGKELPKGRKAEEMIGISPAYVPARNTIMFSYALAWAEVLDVKDIWSGVNGLDYGGFPDCRPEYIKAYQEMANLATAGALEANKKASLDPSNADFFGIEQLKIHTPLIELTKEQIIEIGINLKVPFNLTLSCYDPLTGGRACGKCDACVLRRNGFEKAGIADPTRYGINIDGKSSD